MAERAFLMADHDSGNGAVASASDVLLLLLIIIIIIIFSVVVVAVVDFLEFDDFLILLLRFWFYTRSRRWSLSVSAALSALGETDT